MPQSGLENAPGFLSPLACWTDLAEQILTLASESNQARLKQLLAGQGR